MRHKAVWTYVALLLVLANHIEGREWFRPHEQLHKHEQDSRPLQQQQQKQLEQESVFWHRRVQQLDPGQLNPAERDSAPVVSTSAPAAGGSGEPEGMPMCLTACSMSWHRHHGTP